MSKTALEVHNQIAGNLRRGPYTLMNDDENAQFILLMLNEAKRQVEYERHWNILRRTITFDSAVGVRTYDTSDLAVVTSDPVVTTRRSRLVEDRRIAIPQFWDVTNGSSVFRLQRAARERITDRALIVNNTQARIGQFAIYPVKEGLQVEFPWDPSEVRNYRFEVTTPQDPFTANADEAVEMEIYEEPVVMLATALAAEERGEELGLVASTWYERFDDALAEAIILDSDEVDYTLVAD